MTKGTHHAWNISICKIDHIPNDDTMFHIHKNFIVTNKHLVCLYGKKNTKIKCFDFQNQRKQGVYCNLSKWSTLRCYNKLFILIKQIPLH